MAELSCAELVELVTAYLDGVLDAEAEARFHEHLEICEGCEVYLDQFRRTVNTLGELPDETVPADIRDALLNAFHGWTS